MDLGLYENGVPLYFTIGESHVFLMAIWVAYPISRHMLIMILAH